MNYAELNRKAREEQSNHLAAKVIGRNKVNSLAIQHAPAMLAVVSTWVGQKVCKVNGGLMEKFAKQLPQLPEEHPFFSYFYTTGHGYTLKCDLRVCTVVKGRSCYSEQSIYLCDLENGVVKRVYDAPKGLRADYTEDEVRAIRNELADATNAVRAAQSKLGSFGEHDNH